MSGNIPYWGSLLMGLADVICFTIIVVVWRKTRFRRKAKSYIEKLMKSGKFQREVHATTENRRKYKEAPASSSSEEVYWEGDWAYIGGRYREIKIAGYRAVYCYKYFPQRKSGFRLSKQDYARQQMILNFKNGEQYEAVELVSDFITGHLFRGIRVGWILCVIPASTRWKNEKRYQTFCEEVAQNTGVINGYSLIVREMDRPNTRGGKREDTLEGLRINGSAFVGKRVILFDDVTTTGRSFVQLADNLMDAGATQVVGFFLGKTDY